MERSEETFRRAGRAIEENASFLRLLLPDYLFAGASPQRTRHISLPLGREPTTTDCAGFVQRGTAGSSTIGFLSAGSCSVLPLAPRERSCCMASEGGRS